MLAAARAAGKSDVLDGYAADYPRGPHDQPQSMCPAFGSLRVGLRMRRVATILSAQCTDKRVNELTPALFRKYPTVRDFAAVSQEELAITGQSDVAAE